MNLSLNARLVAAASVVLLLFLGVTGFVLEQGFRNSIEAAQKESLQVHANALIAATELGLDGVARLTHALPEARFFNMNSGLIGEFSSNDGEQKWVSPSMTGIGLSLPTGLERGEQRFSQKVSAGGQKFYVFSVGVTWGEQQGPHGGYTFSVAEDAADVAGEVHGFRRILLGGLATVALVLLMVQGFVLRWSLRPVRQVAEELQDIEQGQREQLTADYPRELRLLTENINALIRNNREHLARYRNGLSDLAHSLKTPLALLQSSIDKNDEHKADDRAQSHIDQMAQIIDYQLQRAAMSGRKTLMAPIDVREVARKIIDAMNKVHGDKSVICHLHVDSGVNFSGDQGDLMELLGNLVDNAYKWCRHRVEIHASRGVMEGAREAIVLAVADDGPGIPAQWSDVVIRRGVRGEPQVAGHGIGLAVVHDIVKVYGGSLEISRSSLGGAEIRIQLPKK